MPSAEHEGSPNSHRLIIATIDKPDEWKRDYESDTKDYKAWKPSSHLLPMKDFRKILKIPVVAEKLKNQTNKTTLTLEFPDMYIMSEKNGIIDDHLVAQVRIPNTKKPVIVCTWPSELRKEEEEELDALQKRVSELEEEVARLEIEKDTVTEERDNLKHDLDQARDTTTKERDHLKHHLEQVTEERDRFRYDLDQANKEIRRLNILLQNPHLPEDQLEYELWEPKQEPR